MGCRLAALWGAGGLEQGGWGQGRVSQGLGGWVMEGAEGLGSGGGGGWTLRGPDGRLLGRTDGKFTPLFYRTSSPSGLLPKREKSRGEEKGKVSLVCVSSVKGNRPLAHTIRISLY